jgi:alginate O-acetyltransferase complex protein AlgI
MLFNSFHFLIFLPVVFILYWFVVKKLTAQNILLLLASYFFYSCWDWRFLFLLLFSTFLDYYTGIKMFDSKNESVRKSWFWLSVIVNVGFLGVFKYFNFFADSFKVSLAHLGIDINIWTLNVILPVGISFYTFHGLSYVIDIYNRKIQPERNIVNYSLFVSFFPLLVAGPIERATHLLPQIIKKREFKYTSAVDGLRQILWGFFKKVVIADSCAEYVNIVFADYTHYSSVSLVIGAVLFSVQIYCDFSGYSDIALGTARLFGIELLQNFSFPYFSRNIAEFWRRWHISLSSWFKDYLYIPLGGSKNGKLKQIRNTFIIFLVSGFWHGANYTFIIWGLLHALFIIPSVILDTNRSNLNVVATPNIKDLFSMLITFILTTIAWVFFRAESVLQAVDYLYCIVVKGKNTTKQIDLFESYNGVILLGLIIIFFMTEWVGRKNKYAIANIFLQSHKIVRHSFYYLLLFLISIYWGKEQQFIYFQF